MGTILDNIGRRKKELAGDKILMGQNVAAAIAAMREGIKSSAWEFYMTPFARDDDGTLDAAKLARLMGTDGTLGDFIMDRKRGYLVGNAMCGDTTGNFLDYGCDSLDDGVGKYACDRFGSPCTVTKPAKKRPGKN
jgi:hypothetical protein